METEELTRLVDGIYKVSRMIFFPFPQGIERENDNVSPLAVIIASVIGPRRVLP